jgi:pimeloyl-ACP methyl ester carboxylesterase
MHPDSDSYLPVPVPGGELAVARWGDGPRAVVAAHGITASSLSWRAVARHIDGEATTLYAPDLRGRGASADLPGPFGLRRHAEDLLALADHLELERPLLAGHSLGAFIAVLAAAARPGLAERVLLVDGGLPLPAPAEGVDPDVALDLILGPALQRLSEAFPSLDAYFDFWRRHPAVGDDWNDDVEAFLSYDVVKGNDGLLRSRVSREAVRADGRDLLTAPAPIGEALRSLQVPVHLLRAPSGLFGEPPGLQPDELVDQWSPQISHFTDELVAGTNHYTLLMGDRGASAVAAALAGERDDHGRQARQARSDPA